jgi:hypothetical protein
MQPSESWKYFAGLRGRTLLHDLLWFVETYGSNDPKAPRSSPSWSWASTDSGISFLFSGNFWTCQILESGCVSVNKFNPKGTVIYGFIRIHSRMLSVQLLHYPKSKLRGEMVFAVGFGEESLKRYSFHPDYTFALQGPARLILTHHYHCYWWHVLPNDVSR